jgi:glycosyltransferase involved in cell wall biosynthesis
MKKNVLQLIGSFHQGGSERQAVQLSRLLHGDGSVNVRVAALNREGALLADAEAIGVGKIPEFRLTSFFDLNFLFQLRRFSRFLREMRIDVVHSHDFYTNVFGMAAARLAGVGGRVASKRETGGMRSAMQDRVERLAFNQARRIVANSEAVRDHLIAGGVDRNKIRVIRNGLDLKRFETLPGPDFRRSVGIPADGRLIALVANLRHGVKNVPMFIRAAARVAERAPDARFVIAGEGELRAELTRLAESIGVGDRVHFIGRCARVPELLGSSFVGALTSLNEGFSNSILEYMAAGLPVVATNVGGAAEAVAHGLSGFLVASDDDEEFARRLLDLLNDEDAARAMGVVGRRTVEGKFSDSAQLSATLDLYGDI